MAEATDSSLADGFIRTWAPLLESAGPRGFRNQGTEACQPTRRGALKVSHEQANRIQTTTRAAPITPEADPVDPPS